MKPIPAKPRIIIAQVDGSGTADVKPILKKSDEPGWVGFSPNPAISIWTELPVKVTRLRSRPAMLVESVTFPIVKPWIEVLEVEFVRVYSVKARAGSVIGIEDRTSTDVHALNWRCENSADVRSARATYFDTRSNRENIYRLLGLEIVIQRNVGSDQTGLRCRYSTQTRGQNGHCTNKQVRKFHDSPLTLTQRRFDAQMINTTATSVNAPKAFSRFNC